MLHSCLFTVASIHCNDNAHILPIDYQNYEIHLQKVINKTGTPAYFKQDVQKLTALSQD